NNKKILVPTTYKSDCALSAQLTIIDPEELDLYKQEYLTSHKAYTAQITSEPDNENWTTYQPQQHTQTTFYH
ncbi:2905_t:CDS:1, partial [Cetraspora pellucida]